MKTWYDAAMIVREAMNIVGQKLTDAEASVVIPIFPKLKGDNSLIKSGTRINWDYQLKRAAVDLWDIEDNNPDNAPNLWEDINYKAGYRIIPDIITTGLAFDKDECGWWKDELYRSKISANTYTPEQYPLGWELVTT